MKLNNDPIYKITPAVLEDTTKLFTKNLNIISEFSKIVHIDVSDFTLVKSDTLDLHRMKDILKNYHFNYLELHMMVEDVTQYFDDIFEIKPEAVIIHIEPYVLFREQLPEIIKEFRQKNIDIGIALNPGTGPEYLGNLDFDFALFLTVYPGKQGGTFKEIVVEKFDMYRRQYSTPLVIDGGVNHENIIKLNKLNIDRYIIGSDILEADDPKKSYEKFINSMFKSK